MMTRLVPYGSEQHTHNVSKVGKSKAPLSLAARMPSPDIVAKVGAKNPVSQSLATRMPSPEIAAKVGTDTTSGTRTHRVVRRNERG
jgi:hypothetical protein